MRAFACSVVVFLRQPVRRQNFARCGVQFKALVLHKVEQPIAACSQVSGVLILEHAGTQCRSIFMFPQKLTVVGVVSQNRVFTLDNQPAVDRQRAHGAFVAIGHFTGTGISEPQNTQVALHPRVIDNGCVGGIAILV